MFGPTHKTNRWRELRQLLSLSASLGAVQVGYHLTGFVDTALAGRTGGEILAATGLGAAILFAFSALGIGTIMGLDPIIAQNIGAGRHDRAHCAMWQGIWASVLVTLPLTLILVVVGDNLTAFGITPSLAGRTEDYLLARLPSILPMLLSLAMRSYLQAKHHTRAIIFSVVGLNVVNLIADWILLFGDEGLVKVGLPPVGLPSFGVMGVGWSSALATMAQTLTLAIAVRMTRQPQAQRSRHVNSEILWRIFVVGAPLGLQLGAEVGVFAAVGVLMGGMGTTVMAAHQIALQFASMTFAVVLGVGSATSVQVGRAIGCGDLKATRRAGFFGLTVGASFMSMTAALMWLLPTELATLMTSDSEVIPGAARLLVVAGVFQVADGVQAVGSGALRGAGVTRWSLAANLVGHWLVGAPIGLALAYGFHLGPIGLWWGLTAGLGTVAISLTAKFVHLSRHPIALVDGHRG
ncbi:MAG: hypothetical protein A2341_05310 [Deltaproteobacteria bacterium RIFOXYB12_FULL_58_9]|nr:MAG: hypothetical protein A2341_05310 [Deltaproteobacteria bacterium RIFOXYB12_FULL_58_9]